MSHNSSGVAVLLLLAGLASAQSTSGPKYLDRAMIQHRDSTATVTANYPTPLFQAVDGIRQEYGWQVNWEEAPCYSHFDVVDDTSPRWRAAHPNAEGVTRRGGGPLASTFPEPKTGELATEEETLRQVIADYNATENPGKYVLRAGPGRQFTVVGTEVKDDSGTLEKVIPILDMPISVNTQPRSATDALDAILQALSSASGKHVTLMSLPNNLFRDTQVALEGHNVTARQLLQDLFHYIPRPLQYDLGFDPDHSSVYILNVSVTAKSELDQDGRRLLVPIDRRK
jgi:hypothetical protein